MLTPRRLFLVTSVIALAACDLPTDAASARQTLGGDADIPFTIPIPTMSLGLTEHLTRPDIGFGTFVDTTSLTLELPRVTHEFALHHPGTFSSNGSDLEDTRSHRLNEFSTITPTGAMLREVQWSDVVLTARVTNNSGAPLALDSMIFTVPGTNGRARVTTGLIPPTATTTTSVPASDLVNALLPLLREGSVPSIGLETHAHLGAGSVTQGDAMTVSWQLRAPLRFTLPVAGIVVQRRSHVQVDATAAGVARSIRSAVLELRVGNSTPINARVTAVLAATPADTAGFDPLTDPSRIELPAMMVAPRGQGTVQRIEVPADRLPTLASGRVSIALRIVLSAGEAVVLKREDAVLVTPVLHVVINRAGGGK